MRQLGNQGPEFMPRASRPTRHERYHQREHSLSPMKISSLLAALPLITVSAQISYAQPTASAAPATPDIQQMQAVENSWDTAVNKRDQYALENLLSPQLVDISAGGDVTTRNQQIAHLYMSGEEPVSLTQKVIGARILGDVAIVNGTYIMQWKGGGEKVAEKGVFTHIFRRTTTGSWLCLNSQRTVVVDEEEKKKAAVRSKTNAALPLHIPLVYKGAPSTQTAPKPGTDQPPQ